MSGVRRNVCVLLLLLGGMLMQSAAGGPPNIVFLLVDDLGWGDFGCYGAEFYETPRIDLLAGEGMRFTDSYSACTVCSPSRAAILTGCYPARLKLTDWIVGYNPPHTKLSSPDWNPRMDHERTLLPEALKQAGYQTAFIGKWHLMPTGQPDEARHDPTRHGFDLNIGGREWGRPKGPGKYFSPFDMPNLEDGEGDYLTDRLTDAAIDFMASASKSDQPFLLYFSYYTVHTPLMAPADRVAKYKEKARTFKNEKDEFLDAARGGMMESLDISVGRLLDKLDALGIADETIVILTSDNGGNFVETSGGLRGFKGFSHEGGVRVPCIVRWPGVTEKGSVCSEMVIGTDLYPTLLQMAGLPLTPERHPDGLSLVSLLKGEADSLERDALYWHYPHYHRTRPYGAIRQGDWKLIEFFEDGALELYNLVEDPKERKNLSGKNPEKAAELLARLKQWRRSVGAQEMTPNPQYDPTITTIELK